MRFENYILKTIVEKLKLRRMRFKVDPAISNLEDFDGNTSYEGYVLNENEGMLNILVVDPNNQVRQTSVFAQGLDVLSDNLNEFKHNLIKILMDQASPQALEQIQNAPTFDEAELLAKNNGATEDDIKNAYRNFHSESTVNEQGLVRRAIGKTADIAKDVLLGKEREPGARGLTGIFGLGTRIGSTLSKLGTKGQGNFQFTQRKSIFHKDRPRSGQKFVIDFNKDGKDYILTGTVGGDLVSGKNKFIQLKNVKAEPDLPQYAKIGRVLVDFDLNSPGANFHIYDDAKRLRDNFSGDLAYDNKTKKWVARGKQTGVKQSVSSQQNIKSLAQSKGYKSYKEPYGKQRLLYKIKGENVYFDSNYNPQTPRTKP